METIFNAIILNVISGLIVGVLQLHIEYNFFKAKSPQRPISNTSTSSKNLVVDVSRVLMSITLVTILGLIISLFVASQPELDVVSLAVSSAVYISLAVLSWAIFRNANKHTPSMSSLGGLFLGVVITTLYILRHLDNSISDVILSINKSALFVVGICIAFPLVPITHQALCDSNSPSIGVLTLGLSTTSLISLYNLLNINNARHLSVWLAWGIVIGILAFSIVSPKRVLLLLGELGVDVGGNLP